MNDRDWSFHTDSSYTILSNLDCEANNASRFRHNIGMNIVILDDSIPLCKILYFKKTYAKTYAENNFKQNLNSPYPSPPLIHTGMTRLDLIVNAFKIVYAFIPAILTACPNNQP
jgi:hypothetical protein